MGKKYIFPLQLEIEELKLKQQDFIFKIHLVENSLLKTHKKNSLVRKMMLAMNIGTFGTGTLGNKFIKKTCSVFRCS